jgi:hypothetical protein
MRPTQLGTANTAQLFAALLAASSPTTASELPRAFEQPIRTTQRLTSRLPFDQSTVQSASTIVSNAKFVAATESSEQLERLTTQHEKLIGEIRSWSLLENNWDGEGAIVPSAPSIKEAVSFTRMLNEVAVALLEPMLLASGHVSLYKNDTGFYADIEFLGDGRIAYFIKRNGDKHKGVLSFDSQKMPAVFSALLLA